MKRLLLSFVMIILSSSLVWASHDTVQGRNTQMLKHVVKTRCGTSSGSGTIVYSGKHKDEVHTYLITNHHVVSSCIKETTENDPSLGGMKVPVIRYTKVVAEFVEYTADYTKIIGGRTIDADIVLYQAKEDMALVRLRDTDKIYSVADMLPKEWSKKIPMGAETYAVGASLGDDPAQTHGQITSLSKNIDGFGYMGSSAQIIFGNSGGALYINGEDVIAGNTHGWFWVGIPSRISGHFFGVTEWKGWLIPAWRVYDWLDREHYNIYSGEFNPEETKKKREESRKQKLKMFNIGK